MTTTVPSIFRRRQTNISNFNVSCLVIFCIQEQKSWSMYVFISRNSVRWNHFDWDRVSSFNLQTGLLIVPEDYRSKNTIKKVASGDAHHQSFCVGQHFSCSANRNHTGLGIFSSNFSTLIRYISVWLSQFLWVMRPRREQWICVVVKQLALIVPVSLPSLSAIWKALSVNSPSPVVPVKIIIYVHIVQLSQTKQIIKLILNLDV